MSKTTGKAPDRGVLIYALGGGRGHATRGAALGVALGDLGISARVLVPDGRCGWARRLGAECVAVPRTTDPLALAGFVDEVAAQMRPALAVLDVFAEGLLRERRGRRLAPRQVGLLRCRKDVGTPRFEEGWDALDHRIDLEPHLGWLGAREAEPFGPVVRWPSDDDAPGRPDVLVVASETPMVAFGRRLAERLGGLGVSVRAVEARAGADTVALGREALSARVVVGPAGYNLTYEACRLGALHVALPQPRPFDDQARRAQAVAWTARSPAAVERLVLRLLEREVGVRPRAQVRPMAALAARIGELLDQ